MTKTSLYIHIPFCEKKCFYCSFVVSIAQQHRIEDYLRCLEKEAQRYSRVSLETIYFGGGTPTFLNEQQLSALIKFIQRNFDCSFVKEFTIEANPEGVHQDKAKLLFDLGINRVSIGMQTFHEEHLKNLGRCHRADQAQQAFHVFRRAGFQNISVDLMYSLPQQTTEDIQEDLCILNQLHPEHISLYNLNIEPNSRFYAKKIRTLSSEMEVEYYHLVVDELHKLGYEQYEVSNFALPGRESLHNQNYWKGGNYIGLGVGAHGHFDGKRAWNVSRLNEYISRLKKGQSPEEGHEVLTLRSRFNEVLLFGLRMKQGINLAELQNTFGLSMTPQQEKMIQDFIQGGWLLQEGEQLKATPKGFLVLDEISARLI